MEKLKALLSDVQAWFSRLTLRERRLVGFAGAAMAVFVVFIVAYSFSSAAGDARRRIASKMTDLNEVQTLAASYRESEQARQAVERQLSASNIQLISYLTDKGTAAGLDIPTMNPRADVTLNDGKIIESGVELNLSDVTLGKLVDFLSTVEQGAGVVKVKNLLVEPRATNQTLNARVTIVTYHLKQ